MATKSITRKLPENPARLAFDAVLQFLIGAQRSLESLIHFLAFSAGTTTSPVGSGHNIMSTSVKDADTRYFSSWVPTLIPATTNSKRKSTISAVSWAIAFTWSQKARRQLNMHADADTRFLKHKQISR